MEALLKSNVVAAVVGVVLTATASGVGVIITQMFSIRKDMASMASREDIRQLSSRVDHLVAHIGIPLEDYRKTRDRDQTDPKREIPPNK